MDGPRIKHIIKHKLHIKEEYSKLKESAGHQGEWRHWTHEPA